MVEGNERGKFDSLYLENHQRNGNSTARRESKRKRMMKMYTKKEQTMDEKFLK
jgi:hypothetical protein